MLPLYPSVLRGWLGSTFSLALCRSCSLFLVCAVCFAYTAVYIAVFVFRLNANNKA